jgi:hypothetical protein
VAGVADGAGEEGFEVAQVEESAPIVVLQLLGALEEPRQPLAVDERREVEDRAGERSDRNPGLDADILRGEGGEVDPELRAPVPPGRRRQVDRRVGAEQAPEPTGGPVAGNGRRGSEHRRHRPEVVIEFRVPHRVHAAVKTMQTPDLRRPRR